MEASINPKELVSLDTTLSTLMLPYLKAFKASVQGYPNKLESEENWRAVLDEIVWALDAKASGSLRWDLTKVRAWLRACSNSAPATPAASRSTPCPRPSCPKP